MTSENLKNNKQKVNQQFKPLKSHERSCLKGKAHPLKPVVLVGAGGITDSVVQEIVSALNAHELIKVQLPGQSDAAAKKTQTTDLVTNLPANTHLVGRIGRAVILYLEKPKNEETPPRIPRANLK